MQSAVVVPPVVRKSICSRSFWTPGRCYRCSTGLAIASLVLLVLLSVFVVDPAVDGLNLKPATCTVLRSEIQKSESCSCGKYCTSSFPCLKIFVEYKPKIGSKNVSNVLLHDTVYEHNDYKKCSTAPCERNEEINSMRVKKFQTSMGQVNEKFPCYFNIKKSDEVVTTTGDFKSVIIHCILWPVLVIIGMILLVLGVFFYTRQSRGPKDGQDVTLVWD